MRRSLAGLCAGIGLAAAVPISAQLRDAPLPHAEGQSITPSFEGWFPNPDGSFSMSFGYMNRNYKQVLDIPVGPNNRFDQGPADRGQPTHFLPRRNTGLFTVTVPKDFGDKKLTWTLVANGQTVSIPGHLRPEWRIDALKEITSGNRPPEVRFNPAGQPGQGPSGTTATMKSAAGQPATIAVWVKDDLVRKRGGGGGDESRRREPVLGVVWSKYRGPGNVTFRDLEPNLDEGGKATTTATFSEPGDYTLRVLAWDASGGSARGVMAVGFQCCWTNGYLNVNVR
jgi:hypothetical protein